jgi:hypothetical protein
MRRGAELLTFVLLAFGGCEGEPRAPIDVRVEFKNTGSEEITTFEVECDPAGGASPVCVEIERAPELYFPEPGLVCSLPVPYVYLTIWGTYGGEELQETLTCLEADRRAIEAWSRLLGYEPPSFER